MCCIYVFVDAYIYIYMHGPLILSRQKCLLIWTIACCLPPADSAANGNLGVEDVNNQGTIAYI